MTREEKKNALHCLKVMIDEEVCEECDLYGTTGTDHCEADCVRVAIKALEQEPKILNTLDFSIDASNGDTNYFVGFRNGLRYSKSLIDRKEPQFESCTEQEPCEDAVSRDAFITRYKEWMRSERGKIPNDDTLAIRVIKSLPSVTPTRKKGHWIGHREHCENLGVIPNGLGAYEWCSNCDYGIDVRDWHKIHHNYCPNCGAEMESGDKE